MFSTAGSSDKSDDIRDSTLRVSAASITLPPRSSFLVDVVSDKLRDGEVVAEGNLTLLFALGVCAARSLVTLYDGRSALLGTNFSNEYRHLFHDTAIAFAYPIADVCECFAPTSADDGFQPTPSDVTSLLAKVHVNLTLPEQQQTELRELLYQFKECFASTSKVRQTPITKHRIITSNDASPINQHPYRVSAKERDVINAQVEEML